MKKIILVDGNNLLFRSYYATAYNGNFMNNSKGFPTNALFGFTNMINKIVKEEQPEYIIVAFDKGKTFRHAEYEEYKSGRTAMPEELKKQFPVAKEMLTLMGIKYYEIDNYEADDIIGTFSEYCNKDSEYTGTIVSSDKDLLQLISSDVDIKLLKQKDYIRYNLNSFKEAYGINPENVVDLKALMGDSSDNIKGVRGIGEKTALKLLQEYKTLDNLYKNIDNIKGKTKEKLLTDKASAYQSYHLATIVKDVPLEIDINDIKYKPSDEEKLNALYEKLEFYSFLKKSKPKASNATNYEILKDVNDLKITKDAAIYLEVLGSNYHTGEIIGLSVYDGTKGYYISKELIKDVLVKLNHINKYAYNLKKLIVMLKKINVPYENYTFDTMIASSLLDYNIKDDIAYLASVFDYNIEFYENIYGKPAHPHIPSEDVLAKTLVEKAKFIYETKDILINELKDNNMYELYTNIEHPLIEVLADMEYTGTVCDKEILEKMGTEFKNRLNVLTEDIHTLAGADFNISSPIQLSKVLFEDLNLPHGKKKTKSGYSTNASVLNKLKNVHPIIPLILEYRALSKLYSTYIESLSSYIIDGKIHTIYTQNFTRTGRLSSTEPNLQNIPVRDELGKLIRKAFVPAHDYILSADYSQIELRVLAHIADVNTLRKAFEEGKDIHRKTASDIFKVSLDAVTSNQRRMAKAVNFGIIYGISGFGLGENLDINAKDAKAFIDTYLETYPEIKKYMGDTISKAKKNGYVTTLFNRKRKIEEINNPAYMIRQSGERIALNTPVQGTSADIMKMAMIKVYRKLNEYNLKSKMIIQVHDEIIIDTAEDEMDIVKEIVKDSMENVCKLSVPLKVDINYGKSWYDAK